MHGRIYTIKYAITKKSSQMVYTTRDGILWTSATRFLIHIKNAEIRAYPIIAIENILFTNLNQLRVFSISKTASLEMETPPPRYLVVSGKITARQGEGKPLFQVFLKKEREGDRRTLLMFLASLMIVVSFSHFYTVTDFGAGDVMHARIHTSPTSPNSGVTSIACTALCNARTRVWKRGKKKGKRKRKKNTCEIFYRPEFYKLAPGSTPAGL